MTHGARSPARGPITGVPGTKSNSGTAESQWWRGLQRSCAGCATCATFFEFLLKNISKHIITSERTFDLKTWHSWHRPVELLYTLTISCGTPGTNLARTWHKSSLSGTAQQNHCISIQLTVNNVPRAPLLNIVPQTCSTNRKP